MRRSLYPHVFGNDTIHGRTGDVAIGSEHFHRIFKHFSGEINYQKFVRSLYILLTKIEFFVSLA